MNETTYIIADLEKERDMVHRWYGRGGGWRALERYDGIQARIKDVKDKDYWNREFHAKP